MTEAGFSIFCYEWLLKMKEYLVRNGRECDLADFVNHIASPDVRAIGEEELAGKTSEEAYKKGLSFALELKAAVHEYIQTHNLDCIVMPTCVVLPPEIGQETMKIGDKEVPTIIAVTHNSLLAPLCGLPALSVSAGVVVGVGGVGIDFMGTEGSELLLCQIGRAFERAQARAGYSEPTPADMKPCDQVTYLSGTVNEFFGFTELNFPSYQLKFPVIRKDGKNDTCLIPPAAVLQPSTITDDVAMEKLESGLVRILSCLCDSGPCDLACDGKDSGFQWVMPRLFGPGTVVNNRPTADASSCDLDGNGAVDFDKPLEAACADACDSLPTCSEWTNFSARNEIKVHGERADGNVAPGIIQINAATVTGFDAQGSRGLPLAAVTGTLREFSGGPLNWTIETRCSDDLVCKAAGCASKTKASNEACVQLRTIDDNDEGTN